MKVCLFSDFHADYWKFQSQPVLSEYGLINSRFANQLEVLTEVFESALENNCQHILFCGDMFHVRGRVPVKVFNPIFDLLKKYSTDIGIHLIPGNHDYADREGHAHALQPFAALGGGVHVYSTPTKASLAPGVWVDFIPYCEDPNDFLAAVEALRSPSKPTKYLVAHQGIQEGIVGSGLVLMNQHELDPKDLKEPLSSYDFCFFGHYHKHQKIGSNIWYVGATQQHDWTDVNDAENRGWLVFDMAKQTMVRHRSKKAYLFYSGSAESLKLEDPTRSFVALEGDKPVEALHTVSKPTKPEEDEENHHLVFSHFDLNGAIDEWIHKTAEPTLNKDLLKQIATQYLLQ